MAKNTVTTPIKDGVQADNSTYSSNQIVKVLTAMDDKIDNSSPFEIKMDASNSSSVTINKTFSEVLDACQNGRIIITTAQLTTGWGYSSIVCSVNKADETEVDLTGYGLTYKANKGYMCIVSIKLTPEASTCTMSYSSALN